MISKLQIIFFILCYLIIYGYYNIIIILVFIYYYYISSEKSDEVIKISMEVKKLNDIIDPDNSGYYEKFLKLDSLDGIYPTKDIRIEQIKIINQMLYLVELDKDAESYWTLIKLNLSELI
jgi:hypothetical protein